MSTPVTPAIVLSDRAINKKLIGELQSIAAFTKLDGPDHATLKKDALPRAIQRHIKENPQLADDPYFLPLFAHRSSPKNDVKTSAVKAAEEEVEATKPQPAATGRKHATESEHEDGSDSSVGGDLAPLDVAGNPEPEIEGETVVNSQGMKGKSASVYML
ncbi:hypothetical protein B0H13DRAFT_2687901 [Mycena leptocephala]|nr:hypothetical protein B0H13DRAFT_2687901 [Mycena leptocephala]